MFLLAEDGIGLATCSIERMHYHIKSCSSFDIKGMMKKGYPKSNWRRTSEAELQALNHKLECKPHDLRRTDRDGGILLMPYVPVDI